MSSQKNGRHIPCVTSCRFFSQPVAQIQFEMFKGDLFYLQCRNCPVISGCCNLGIPRHL